MKLKNKQPSLHPGKLISVQLSSVQLLSHVWLFVTSWTATRQASLSITSSLSLLKLISIESVMLSNHLILCHCLLLLPSIFPSTKVFSNEVAKILELQFQHQSLQCIVRTDFLYVWLIWSLCCPRDSQELSSTQQIQKPLAFSFLYDSTLTSVHDYWKNNSFD